MRNILIIIDHPLSKRHQAYLGYTKDVLANKGFNVSREIRGERQWRSGTPWGAWRQRAIERWLGKILRGLILP